MKVAAALLPLSSCCCCCCQKEKMSEFWSRCYRRNKINQVKKETSGESDVEKQHPSIDSVSGLSYQMY